MKNLIILFSIVLVVIISGCSTDTSLSPEELTQSKFLETSLVVDELDGTNTITGEQLLEKWSEEQSQVNARSLSFKTVVLERMNDENGELLDNKVFIKSQSLDGSISIGTVFTQQDDGTYTRDVECTCTSTCSNGCNVSTFGGKCKCSQCFQSHSGTCTKTEKLIITNQ